MKTTTIWITCFLSFVSCPSLSDGFIVARSRTPHPLPWWRTTRTTVSQQRIPSSSRRRGERISLVMAVPPFTVVNGDDGYQHHHHDDDDTSSMSSSTEKTNVTQQDNGDEADTTAPSSSTTTTTTTTPSLLSSLLPNKGSSSSSSSDNEALFSEDPSDQLYSAADWLHNIRSLPGSLILRDIRGPVLAVTGWAAVISVAHAALARRGVAIAAARLCLSDRPHGFLASALGLLLVFRTNSAYQRFAEARKLWEGILSTSRNLSRTVVLFERELGAERVRRILRLLATFPYALDEHVNHERWYERGTAEQARLRTLYEEANGNTNGDDGGGTTTSTDVLAVPRHVYQRRRGVHRRTVGSVRIRYIDTRTLPWCLLPDATRRKCAVAENRPLFVVDRLAREVMEARLTPNFTHRERSALLTMVDGLCSSMGACERIHQTAVPLNYARHALRCVSLWLFTLPLALVKDFGLGTAPVVMCLAWSYFGIYQIGYTIEDPFQSALRLDTLCDAIYRNVMFGTPSMRRRLAALDRNAPPGETDADWRDLPLPPMPVSSFNGILSMSKAQNASLDS